jgi:ankyrin repeat protein
MKLLLERKDVTADLKDDDDRTPLWWAARNGYEAVVMLLI